MLKMYQPTGDPWDIWILDNCYIDGVGTPKDGHQAAILTSYIVTHDDVYEVSQMVGSDDAAQMRDKARLELLMNPPMKSTNSCVQVTGIAAQQPGVVNGQKCSSVPVVDDNSLQHQLHAIEGRK